MTVRSKSSPRKQVTPDLFPQMIVAIVVACFAGLASKLLWSLSGVAAESGIFLAGVVVAGWLAGSRSAGFAIAFSVLIAGGFFANPIQFLLLKRPEQDSSLTMLFVEGTFIAYLSGRFTETPRLTQSGDESLPTTRSDKAKLEVNYKQLIESIKSCAIFLVDRDGRVASWNESAARLTGYDADEILGMPLSVLDVDAVNAGVTFRRAMQAAISGDHGADIHIQCVRKQGMQFWADVSICTVKSDAETTELFAVILRDVTSRKQAEDLLEQRSRQLMEASRLKDEFLATVSHELRTPLNSILGWTQLFRAGKLDDDGKIHALETIEQSAKTQARLIEDLLDVSRIVTGKLRLEIRSLQISEVIEAAVETVRPAADGKNISIHLMLESVGCPLFGDPNRLQQVLWNLLSNAIKFTHSGGLVQVLLHRHESSVRIAVKDNGMGIKPEFLPHVFDAFRQADSSSTRSHKGLGLGLTIVRRLIELHGGTVRVESDGAGSGTMFEVTLPVSVTPKSSATVSTIEVAKPISAASVLTNQLPANHSLRVVVVDDDPEARELIAAVLSHNGIQANVVSSAAEGLLAIERTKPDVVVSDIEMPDEDGYMFIQELRSLDLDHGGRTPAVALTAYTRSEDRSRSLAAGFQMHLGKPIEADELVNAIVLLANQRRKGTSHAQATRH